MNTKQQELDALRAFAQELGPNWYIGPWLLDIERDMRSDLPPVVTWADLRGLHAAAFKEAKEIRKALRAVE